MTRPCVQCKKQTATTYSLDMDLPPLFACNSKCLYTWLFLQDSAREITP